MNEEELEKDYNRSQKIIYTIFYVLLFFTIIVVSGLYYVITSPIWCNGYIVDFDEKTKLTQQEQNQIMGIMGIDKDVEITKLAYRTPFRHETTYFIFYTEKNTNTEYIFKDIVSDIHTDEDYLKMLKIFKKYYKRWQNPWKSLDVDYEKVINK